MKKKTDWKKKLTKSQQVALGAVKRGRGNKTDRELAGTYDDPDYGDVKVTKATLHFLYNKDFAFGLRLRLTKQGEEAANAVGY